METINGNVEIIKQIMDTECCFTQNFRGFESVQSVRGLFREATAETLENIIVEFTSDTLYMRVTDEGRILINPRYFRKASFTDLYLDIIHELVHVKQAMEGKTSNPNVSYVERPLEIEAYGITVAEARKLRLSRERIIDYLKCDLINNEDLKKLSLALKLNVKSA